MSSQGHYPRDTIHDTSSRTLMGVQEIGQSPTPRANNTLTRQQGELWMAPVITVDIKILMAILYRVVVIISQALC